MNRWATNAQALIKSEAAFSNGMAAEVGGHLDTLRRRVDACEKPNIDKEVCSLFCDGIAILFSYFPFDWSRVYRKSSVGGGSSQDCVF